MYEYEAHVYNVVDGDTIDIIWDFGCGLKQPHRLRFFGINCQEVHLGKHTDQQQKEAGLAAEAYVVERLLDKDIIIHTIQDKEDDFGRYLAVVFLDGININLELLDKGYASLFMVKSRDEIV